MSELLGPLHEAFAALERENEQLRTQVAALAGRVDELEVSARDESVPFPTWVRELSTDVQARIDDPGVTDPRVRQQLRVLAGMVDLMSEGDAGGAEEEGAGPGGAAVSPSAGIVASPESVVPPAAAPVPAAPVPAVPVPAVPVPAVPVPAVPVRPSPVSDLTAEAVLAGPTADAPPHRVAFRERRPIPGMEGVEYRPHGHMHRESWLERRAPWFNDLMIRLDFERVERGLDRLADRLERVLGFFVEPLEPLLLKVLSGVQRVTRTVGAAVDRLLGALPMPVVVRQWLWIGPQLALAEGAPSTQKQMKSRYESMIWLGIITSTVAHFAIFAFWPELQAEDVSFAAEEITAIEMPPEIEIPPPPQAMARPATPVIATGAEVDEDITIAPTTFEENPVEELPPPPEATVEATDALPTFTPFTVAPRITNAEQVARMMEREYPPSLKNAGIGGEVVVWFYIDESGRVQETRVFQTSGYEQLDGAALTVADRFEFTPALDGDRRVAVWIQFPLTFRVR